MSRITYGESDDPVARLWQATKGRVLAGKPGQAFLKNLESALLAMPDRKIVSGVWIENGEVCSLAALDVHRRMANGMCWDHARLLVEHLVEEEWTTFVDDDLALYDYLPKYLHTSWTMAWEVMEKNDEQFESCTPADRWAAMLRWVQSEIKG